MNLFKGILPLISVGLCCMCHLLHQVLYTRGSGLTEIYPLLNPTKHLAENWNTTDIREWIPFFFKGSKCTIFGDQTLLSDWRNDCRVPGHFLQLPHWAGLSLSNSASLKVRGSLAAWIPPASIIISGFCLGLFPLFITPTLKIFLHCVSVPLEGLLFYHAPSPPW